MQIDFVRKRLENFEKCFYALQHIEQFMKCLFVDILMATQTIHLHTRSNRVLRCAAVVFTTLCADSRAKRNLFLRASGLPGSVDAILSALNLEMDAYDIDAS